MPKLQNYLSFAALAVTGLPFSANAATWAAFVPHAGGRLFKVAVFVPRPWQRRL